MDLRNAVMALSMIKSLAPATFRTDAELLALVVDRTIHLKAVDA